MKHVALLWPGQDFNPGVSKTYSPEVKIQCAYKPIALSRIRLKYIPVKLPWIFPGVPLNFNGAPANIQGNLTGMEISTEQLIPLMNELSAQLRSIHLSLISYHTFPFSGIRLSIIILSATFSLINGGERVDKDLLHRVLRRVYPDDTDVSSQCFRTPFIKDFHLE